jgi:hypothetical protein
MDMSSIGGRSVSSSRSTVVRPLKLWTDYWHPIGWRILLAKEAGQCRPVHLTSCFRGKDELPVILVQQGHPTQRPERDEVNGTPGASKQPPRKAT